MKTVYIYDYLGIHSGCHYYNNAFRDRILERGIPALVLSNYAAQGEAAPFLLNQYRGNKIQKVLSLLKNLCRIRRFVRLHPTDVHVILSYGNWVDILFFRAISRATLKMVDVHEAVAMSLDGNRYARACLSWAYRNYVDTVIVHSPRTKEILDSYGFPGTRLQVPHFRYSFPKMVAEENVAGEVSAARVDGLVNILFFGNLSKSKGVDILVEAVNALPPEQAKKLNIIIAGRDQDGTISRLVLAQDRNWHLIIRRLNDDEMTSLFSSCDYVALPYRITSQSGILEMAAYFRKPVLLSDIPYFRGFLAEFPSFGRLTDISDFARTLAGLPDDQDTYYAAADCDRFDFRSEVDSFLDAFAAWMER